LSDLEVGGRGERHVPYCPIAGDATEFLDNNLYYQMTVEKNERC